MKNLKKQILKTIWRTVLTLVLVAGFAALSAVGWTQLALADAGGVKGHTFDVTFTKWLTSFPHMVGVVGGDVGDGTYAGKILNIGTVGNITTIHALYHINGGTHAFTADVVVTQDNVLGMAVITGRVTEGWLKSAPVTGGYKVWASCPILTPGNGQGTKCFQGTLHIQRGGGD